MRRYQILDKQIMPEIDTVLVALDQITENVHRIVAGMTCGTSHDQIVEKLAEARMATQDARTCLSMLQWGYLYDEEIERCVDQCPNKVEHSPIKDGGFNYSYHSPKLQTRLAGGFTAAAKVTTGEKAPEAPVEAPTEANTDTATPEPAKTTKRGRPKKAAEAVA